MAQRFDTGAANPDVEGDIHGDVATFLTEFTDALLSQNVSAANRLYEQTFVSLTEQFYTVDKAARYNKDRSKAVEAKFWPQLKFVKKYIGDEVVIEQLYTAVLHYRSVYASVPFPSADVRKKAWDANTALLGTLVTSAGAAALPLDAPNGLLWDTIDEFVYQLQVQRNGRRGAATNKQDRDLGNGVWTVEAAVKILTEVRNASGVAEVLATSANPAQAIFTPGPKHVRLALGYFAAIGLVRIATQLGDYFGALAAASAFRLNTPAGLAASLKVPPAHGALHYYVGFAMLMLRRYTDAVALLQQALAVKAVSRPYLETLQSQVVMLLHITSTLGDVETKDYVALVPQKARALFSHDEDLALLASGDVDRYRDIFARAAPKFFTAVDDTTTFSESTAGQEAREVQLRVFMRGVQQQLPVLKLRGYLRVYATADHSKIAALLSSVGDEDVTKKVDAKAGSAEGQVAHVKMASRQAVIAAGGKDLAADVTVQPTGRIRFTSRDGNVVVRPKDPEPSAAMALFEKAAALPPTVV